MKKELIKAHMQTAYNYANLSKAVRRKVGCIIVKDDRIITASDDLATEPPTVPPRWCPMRLEQIVVQLDIAPDRTSN